MSEKNYITISAAVFAFVAIMHLIRVITHWSVQIGTSMFPLWGSGIIFVIALALSIWAFRLLYKWKQVHQV